MMRLIETKTTDRIVKNIPGGICRLNDVGCDCYVFDKTANGYIARGGFWYLSMIENETDDFSNDFDYVYIFETKKTYRIKGGVK